MERMGLDKIFESHRKLLRPEMERVPKAGTGRTRSRAQPGKCGQVRPPPPAQGQCSALLPCPRPAHALGEPRPVLPC